MLHSRHIVVADFPGGSSQTLYQGADPVAAFKAMAEETAKGEAEAVLLFSHPMPTSVRYPLQDKAAAEARAAEAKAAEERASNAEGAALEAKKAEVKRLQKEIRDLS